MCFVTGKIPQAVNIAEAIQIFKKVKRTNPEIIDQYHDSVSLVNIGKTNGQTVIWLLN
jgi:hypothetical protein